MNGVSAPNVLPSLALSNFENATGRAHFLAELKRAARAVGFFFGARLDATVPALEWPAHLAAEAPGFDRDPQNRLFHHVGQNTLKGRLRSHPDVARCHHADLLAAP